MSSMQINACWSFVKFRSISSSSQSCYLPAPHLHNSRTHVFRLPKTRLRLVYNAPSYQRCTPVCLFGGKGKSENDNEASPWKALEKAMGGLRKEPSVQDLLRKQMQELEFDDDGGSGNRPPGGGGDDSGGSEEDESLAGILDEVLQVILATMGFIFLYIYILRGEEMTRLAKDYIWYLFGARKSVRLMRAMYKWGKFRKTVTRKRIRDEYWLERAIINTPTWWHDPRRLKRMLRQAQVAPSYQ
eukprot:TRINITY_DN1142_c0_g1_i1.p1 TRINITY_DN1142_c0_g1~~TRINITY_DN1142_c0_g1_i1.p1  ORF type:complete len:243 (+),score=35.68 TRINITY_DN1142_c0_g1_i1:327-1055(+)